MVNFKILNAVIISMAMVYVLTLMFIVNSNDVDLIFLTQKLIYS